MSSQVEQLSYAPFGAATAPGWWQPARCEDASTPTGAEWFTTADGVRLAISRQQARRTAALRDRAILVAPGLFTSKDCPEHRAVREQLAEIADVLTVDMRGHGESEGRFTWGVREPADVAALAAQLRREYARVGAVGFSFGGYHVGAATALHRAFDAVAMIATPRSFSPLDRHFLFRGLRKSFFAARRRRGYAGRFTLQPFCRSRKPAAAWVSAIAPTPLLIVHGTGDWLLGTHHANDLFTRAQEPKSLLFVERAPHAEGMMVEHAGDLMPPLVRFLDQQL